jgi:ABC-type multidrug transport system fused ATPase/permease subunit
MVFSANLLTACVGWLGHWANQYTLHDYVSVKYYLGWYAAVVAATLGTYVSTSAMTNFASVRMSRIVHHRLLTSIMASSFRWLDQTPVSRIISRSVSVCADTHVPLLTLA